VGSDGLIRTAVTNLATNSEDAAAAFTANTATITANQIAAPTGAITADQVTGNAGSANKFLTRNISATQTGAYTFSIYLKAGTESSVVIRLTEGGANGLRVAANLSNGTVSVTNEGTTASGQAGTITNVGGGWYRVTASCSFSSLPFSVIQPQIWLNTFGSVSLTTDFFLWGAQLEQSSTVGEYIPTTSTINSAPRFDHNPTTGESLGLLVEEQRTNLVLQSEDFSTTWAVTRSTITTNTTTAPNGTATADKLVEDSTASSTHFVQQAPTFVSGTTYTYSVYAKAAERTQLRIQGANQATWPGDVRFDLSNGTIASTTAGTAAIQAAGNGWYRCSITATSGQSFATNIVHYLVSGTAISYTGDGTSGIFLWGAQLETGAFPTSYIPTTTAAVTRSADVASISGSNFSAWYRQDEGTVFWDGRFNTVAVQTAILSLSDSASPGNNRHSLRIGNTIVTSGGTLVASLFQTPVVQTPARYAYGYAVDNYCQVLNSAATTDLSGALPVGVNNLEIGKVEGSQIFSNGTIRRLTYWPTRLSNSTLQAVTQ
jgi:hypothetical protein